jgi:GT2 family glycosyltransferase
MLTVALCAVCHDREEELYRMLESTRGVGWNEVLVLDMASEPAVRMEDGITWLRSESNLGPAAGRNRLADAATSDILVFLDDDAILLTPTMSGVVDLFERDQQLGLVAFQIHREDGRITSAEYPFRGPVRGPDRSRPCAYFVAAGYACRRDAIRGVGGYDELLVIYGEELELSFNLARAGWELKYFPEVSVEHKPSPKGRTSARAYWPNTMRNRCIVARKYLPVTVGVIHLACWAVLTGAHSVTAGGLGLWLKEVVAGMRMPIARRPLAWNQLRRLHALGGRVLW